MLRNINQAVRGTNPNGRPATILNSKYDGEPIALTSEKARVVVCIKGTFVAKLNESPEGTLYIDVPFHGWAKDFWMIIRIKGIITKVYCAPEADRTQVVDAIINFQDRVDRFRQETIEGWFRREMDDFAAVSNPAWADVGKFRDFPIDIMYGNEGIDPCPRVIPVYETSFDLKEPDSDVVFGLLVTRQLLVERVRGF